MGRSISEKLNRIANEMSRPDRIRKILEDRKSSDRITGEPVKIVRRNPIKLEKICKQPSQSGKGLPLSFAQRRQWFLYQLEPDSSAYNISILLKLTGRLNRCALEQSIREIVRRHEVLRTVIVEEGGEARQQIRGGSEVSIEEIDISHLPEEKKREQVERLVREESSRGFDLTRGPLMRVKVIKQGHQQQVLAVTMHHIVTDGWSMSVMVEEMRRLYEAYSRGEESGLEELKIQYADYAQWQREQEQSEEMSRQMEYWKGVLGGELPVLEMGGKSRNRQAGKLSARRERLELGEELNEKIERMSRSEGVTKFMVMEAAFKVLLQRYSGQEDLIVGTPIANRRRAEVEGLIGFFVNTVALRSRVEGRDKFEEVLRREREVCLGAYGNQDAPFERVVEEIRPERQYGLASGIHSPIFQTIFALQNTKPVNLRLPGLILEAHNSEASNAKFDLSVALEESSEGLVGIISYNAELYEKEMIRRMAGHYKKILEEVTRDANQTIDSIDMLSEQEKQQLIFDWNQTSSAFSSHLCIHHLFQLQAALSPDSISAAFGHHQLSFAQLDRRSNQMAAYLSALGAGPEQKVGICLQSRLDMICWLVGILKSGAAYVPLDASYPRQRLAFIMKDSEVKLVVTSALHSDRLVPEQSMAQSCDPQIIEIERAEQSLNSYSEEAIDSGVSATNLAYVIYTSGSTGRPKGVEVEHRSVVNLLTGMKLMTGFSESDRLMSVTRLSFDIAGLEIYLPMMSGGRLEIASREEVQDGRALSEQMKRRQATVMQATPAGWRMVLESGWEGNERLRMLVGGEAVTSEQARRMKEKGGRVWNVYGPTETTIWSTKYEVEGGMEEVSIGKPIANTRVYIVDGKREIVGQGVEGEMEIGGEGVARGYRGRAEETAERYVPEMWSEEGGRRVYRTGDRCRYREGGEIEYLGRKDEQMKVRGYRVEAGEIEEALKEGKGVREAVVVKKERRGEGEEEIVGYVEGGEGESEQEMRERVRRKLPEYMVPRRVVKMERLPLTANGKVDRRALREREDEAEQREGGKAKAETAVEEVLSGIWAEVLGMEEVGVDESFFDLGGHSLLATQVISRIRDAFRVDMPLRVLLESPTVKVVAQKVEVELGASQLAEIFPISPAPRDQELRLSHGQERLWFLDRLEPDSPAWNFSLKVKLTGRMNRAALEQSIREIIRRHEVLRTVIVEQGGEPRQQVRSGGEVSIEEIDVSQLPEEMTTEQVERLVRQESCRGFDLARGPLMRVKVIKQGKQQQVLAVTMHHIVTDGWSMSVMVEEMSKLYEAYSRGEESGLEELKIQYADYAQWQREQEQSEIISRQMDYWKGVLGGELPVLEMGGKSRNRQAGKLSARRERLELGEELNEKLERMSRSEGVTKFMMMEAAFKVLLQRYSGQEDLIVGTVIANRRRAEVEGLIGFFVNTVALRSRVEGRDKFEEVLRREREVCLGAYGNQDAPFEKVVEEVAAGRDPNRSPLFQAVFGLQNAPQEILELEGLVIDAEELDTYTAKHELALFISGDRNRLRATFEYNTEVYDEREIKEMAKGYKRLLEGIVEDGGKRIDEYRMIDEQEADGYKAVDFSGAELSQKDFENLIAALSNHIY